MDVASLMADISKSAYRAPKRDDGLIPTLPAFKSVSRGQAPGPKDMNGIQVPEIMYQIT